MACLPIFLRVLSVISPPFSGFLLIPEQVSLPFFNHPPNSFSIFWGQILSSFFFDFRPLFLWWPYFIRTLSFPFFSYWVFIFLLHILWLVCSFSFFSGVVLPVVSLFYLVFPSWGIFCLSCHIALPLLLLGPWIPPWFVVPCSRAALFTHCPAPLFRRGPFTFCYCLIPFRVPPRLSTFYERVFF